MPYITEFIFVPIATVDTPNAKAIIFLLINLRSSKSIFVFYSWKRTRIRDITKADSPHTKYETELLVSLDTQSIPPREFVAALPTLLTPS